MQPLRLLLRSLVDFFRDGGLMLAGSLSYFTMMAIVPFCIFLVTVLGHFLGGNREFYQFFASKLVGFFPRITAEITDELKGIITHRGIGTLSLILYGFLSLQLYGSLEWAVNTIFKLKVRRSFIVSLFLSFVIVTLIMGFLIISFATTSLIPMLSAFGEYLPLIEMSHLTRFLIRYVVPFFLVFLVVVTLYVLLPKRSVRLSHALSGALFTTALLEAAKHFFAVYVVKVAKLGTVYGPLSAFVFFLLWMFYSSCIFLIGAEVVHNLGAGKKR